MESHLQNIQPFLLSLGIGLMMGLERERRPDARIGLRSFALIGVCGCAFAKLSTLLSDALPLTGGLLTIGACLVLDRWKNREDDEPDAVTMLAAALCYALGAMALLCDPYLVTVVGFSATAMLYFKAELHGLAQGLSRHDLLSFLQFLLISCIILPLLPDRDMGPLGALNPFRIWLMVALICGLSLTGYAVLRLLGPGRSVAILGILGGMVSSTATTLVYSRHARRSQVSPAVATFVILAANMVLPLRLLLLASILDREVTGQLALMLLPGWAVGLLFVAGAWKGLEANPPEHSLEMSNPVELKPALTFAAIFSVALMASAWLNRIAGASGVYLVAAVTGLTDVDATALSSLQLHVHSNIDAKTAVASISLACLVNLVFKGGMAAFVGGKTLGRPILFGFSGIGASWVLALLVVH